MTRAHLIAALMCHSGLTSPGRALYIYRRAIRFMFR